MEREKHYTEAIWLAGDDLVAGEDDLRRLREKTFFLHFLQIRVIDLWKWSSWRLVSCCRALPLE
jgi:hypothetical protein